MTPGRGTAAAHRKKQSFTHFASCDFFGGLYQRYNPTFLTGGCQQRATRQLRPAPHQLTLPQQPAATQTTSMSLFSCRSGRGSQLKRHREVSFSARGQKHKHIHSVCRTYYFFLHPGPGCFHVSFLSTTKSPCNSGCFLESYIRTLWQCVLQPASDWRGFVIRRKT